MLKQLFLTAAILASLQLIVPSSISCEEVYSINSCEENECGSCNDESPKWKSAAALGGLALVAGVAGALGSKAVKKNKGSSGSRGPAGQGNRVIDEGNTLSFSSSITINSVLALGGHLDVTAFVMQPDLSFVYINQTIINTNGTFPIDLEFTTTDPEFGRWVVGFNIDGIDAIGSTVDFTKNILMTSSRFGSVPVQGVYEIQTFEFTLAHEDEQDFVEFPYFAITLL